MREPLDTLPVCDESTDDACRRPTLILDLHEDGHLRLPPFPDEPLHPHPFEADYHKDAER